VTKSKFKGRGAGEGAGGPPPPPHCPPPSGGLLDLGEVIDFRGCLASMGGVRPVLVVETQAGSDLLAGFDHVLVAFEVNILVFEAAPEQFDEAVVQALLLPIFCLNSVLRASFKFPQKSIKLA
jgi:hypothetical protein